MRDCTAVIKIVKDDDVTVSYVSRGRHEDIKHFNDRVVCLLRRLVSVLGYVDKSSVHFVGDHYTIQTIDADFGNKILDFYGKDDKDSARSVAQSAIKDSLVNVAVFKNILKKIES